MIPVVLGLGSSLGDRAWILEAALRVLVTRLPVVAVSRVWWSPPAGGVAQGHFLNAAVKVLGRPREVLGIARELEQRFGRVRARRWMDRTLDVDLLWAEGVVLDTPELVLPHPRLADRHFALAPLLEVAPEARDPRRGGLLADWPSPRPFARPVACLPAPVGLDASGRGCYGDTREPTRSAPMKFFIDTANLDHIRQAAAWGIVDGVTTNPSLIAKEGGDFIGTIAEICTIIDGPVSAEVVAESADDMVKQGLLLARVHDNVVVKVPLTEEGITATARLSAEGVKTNVTLCFSPVQALIAAKAGATYISPFVGRLDDIGNDGMNIIEQIVEVYANYPRLETQVLAASIRHTHHVLQSALAGADVATIPFGVMKKLFGHPLTTSGNAAFNAAWEGVPDRDIVGQVSRWLEKNER